MASLKHADSKKNMYSWWWNSHISPKNSKWLQENLTDMDVKVKSMIKLIEEDADSFARRAEMYYKKRPELMKLVEEFYRAYRALAERYDHATGALRQAHQTMAEAFPNQVPMNPDDSPANTDSDPRTSEMSTPTRSFFDSEDFQKDASGLSLSQSEGRVRKGLNFNMSEEDGGFSETKKGGKMEKEILSLKDSLAKIEAEKEAALIQYEESLERLSKLGLEVALAQRKSRETTERANKAEAEARDLKEALSRLEAEKEGSLLQYRKCLERITFIENDLSRAKDDNALLDERAREAEKEAGSLTQQLAKLESEKDAALEMISELEEKLRRAEEDARKFSERAEKAEGEVLILKEMMAKLTEEKEAEGVQYQQCLKTIASLEHKLLLAQEDAERLNGEIDDGVAKLKGAEDQCVNLERSNESLHAELESMVLKMGSQSQELTEKQKELGRLWSSIQEERLRFAESETAFQTLQNLHSQAQEELRSMASELQSRAHILEDMEARNQSLQDEILSYKEENKNLTELNLASATLTKDMRDEIFSLKESKGKLEDEISLRTNERNTLQQEIYCLKEELNELNRKHRVILEQVDTVGLNPEFLGSSVKELQDDNLNLKEVCQRERSERLALLEKLEIKENSLSDLREEILKCKEENKTLNNLNLAGAALTKDMRDEIFSLKDSKEKLEEEVDRRVDQGNALQLDIDSLKEELNKLNRKHHIILEQVDAAGLKPESIGSSVKELRDENSNLKEVSLREKSEKLALLEKLVTMGQLLEKNAVLESSLSDLSAELEGVRRKLKVIEDSCRSLLEEKSTLTDEKASLLDQLRVATEEMEKLSEKNSVMENSLSDAHTELEVLKSKSKILEDSCQLLTVEKSALITEKGSLVSEIEITQGSLKELEIRYVQLEEKCSAVERERASTLSKVEELEKSLAVQKQEHDHYALMNSKQLAGMEGQICQLTEESMATRKEFEEELDKGFKNLKNLENRYAELEEKCSAVEREKVSALFKVAELEKSLAEQKQEHDHYALMNSEQLAGMEGQIRQLMEESMAARKEFEEELDKGFKNLKNLENRYAELEEKCSAVERERASALFKVEELEKSLAVQKQDHDHYALMNGEQLASMEGEISQLKEEGMAARKEFEEELEKGFKSLKDLEVRYAELEEKCSSVENDRASSRSKVEELEKSLAVQKQEHDHYAQMNSVQLASMEGQIHQLKEEGMAASREFEEELDKGFNLQTEIFVLVRCIKDLEEKNFSLVNDFQKLLEASKSSEKLIFVLEKEKSENQVMIKSLSDHIDALRVQMHQLLMVFDIRVDRNCEDKNGHDQTCLNHILSKAEGTKHALSETEDESRQLAVEVSILVTLLTQLRTELANLESEKNTLGQELTAKNEKLLKLQDEADKLNVRNEELGLKLTEGEQKEEVLVSQIENLRGELLEVHGAYGNLLAEKIQVCKEKMVLMKELSDVKDKVDAVDAQNGTYIDELYDQSVLALVLKNYLEEKSVAICGLGEDLDKLNGVNSGLLEKLTVMERELEGVKMENRDLKETLQKSEHELETVAFVSDELNCEILNVKNLLGQKEREFSEAEEKLKLTEDEKTELYEIVEGLKREYDEVKMKSEEQGRQILELSDTNNLLSEEQIFLQETVQMLELELHKLHEEHGKTIKMLESEAEANYGEFQTSSIYQALLVLKVRELAEAFANLQEENMSKDMNFEALEERAESLESENGGLKSQLASYGSALVSLRGCIVSLENRIRSTEDVKGAELVNGRGVEDSDELSEFLDLENRVKTIEISLIELERLRIQENTDANTKLESVSRQMEELKRQQSYHKKERKPTSEILEVGTKDIVLDQESESSSQEKRREGEHQMHDQDDNIDLTTEKSKRIVKPRSEDMLLEKELGVDKLEISKRFEEPQVEGNKRKVLERLNSDDQKLTNLHITVQDLKKKVEITEKGKSGKAVVECDTIKAQLEEAEAAIQKLFDLTAKLMKNIEDSSFTLEKNDATELEKSQSTKRKRISEQARRISEKIGRLQLEVQKIQFVLLKLDDDKESKGRKRYLDTKRRVALKDYLYGGGRTKATIHRKKKAPFCACIDPPTSD